MKDDTKTWEAPVLEEIRMDAEIGSYQADDSDEDPVRFVRTRQDES
jgi:hypothetical protein